MYFENKLGKTRGKGICVASSPAFHHTISACRAENTQYSKSQPCRENDSSATGSSLKVLMQLNQRLSKEPTGFPLSLDTGLQCWQRTLVSLHEKLYEKKQNLPT